METRANPPKKVRLACRRCRTRRVKCDGQTPACANCAKAGQICLDVDSQNSDILIPRNFAGAARARIQWLEGIIRDRVPDIDLQSGPQVELPPEAVGSTEQDQETSPVVLAGESVVEASLLQEQPGQSSRKRSADAAGPSDHDSAFPERAHSVTVNLGMLSLNSDSPQKHYLGSSSGLLFANLIGASPSSTASTPQNVGEHAANAAIQSEWRDELGDPARDHARRYNQSLIVLLRQELPRKDDALVLVHNYLRWIHPDYPILEPASLMSALAALYSCVSSASDADLYQSGWPRATPTFRWNGVQVTPGATEDETVSLSVVAFIFFMIFSISALVKVRSRVYDFPPDKFYRAAMHISQGAFAQVSLSSIQALVMLIAHSMLTPAEVKLWTLVHLALAHCVEVGIHREQHEDGPPNFVLQQIRRFTFFTIYSLDRSISSIQGRPLGFRDETFDVKMPETHPSDIADDEEQFLASFSAAVTQYSIHKYRMDRIVSDIKLHLYHLPNDSSWFPWPANPDSHQLRIKGELERWREAVSHESFNYLGLEQRQRQIWRLKLEILYHTTMVLLFQPSQVIRTPSREALRVCFDNASCIIRDYQLLHDLHGLQHGWRAVQNIFAAGATLIYSFWTSDWVRQQASTTDVSKSLRTCSNLLTIGGEWWPSAKSGQSSLGAVADLTLRKLYIQQIPSKHPRLSHAATPLNEFQIDTRRPFSDESTSALQLAGEGDTTQELGDIALNNHVSAWTRGDSAGVSTANAESWGPEFDMADQARENAQFAPEIESFLADFDKSEFSWSYPLDHTEHHFDMDNFPASGF